MTNFKIENFENEYVEVEIAGIHNNKNNLSIFMKTFIVEKDTIFILKNNKKRVAVFNDFNEALGNFNEHIVQ